MAEREFDNQQMQALRAQIEGLKLKKLTPLPTPEVGRPVVWYKKGDRSVQYAAIVVCADGPGQVSLKVFEKNNHNQVNANGVYHVDHPFPEQNVAAAKMNGLWDYKDGDKRTQAHGELHITQIDKQIKGLEESLRQELTKEIQRKQAASHVESVKSKGAVVGAAT